MALKAPDLPRDVEPLACTAVKMSSQMGRCLFKSPLFGMVDKNLTSFYIKRGMYPIKQNS